MIRAIDVQKLIDLYGESLILVKKSFSAYNTSTGTITASSSNVSVLGYQGSFEVAEIDGSEVIRGDRRVYFGSRAINNTLIDPEVDDQIEGVGDTATIIGVTKIMSGSTPVCYICHVRE